MTSAATIILIVDDEAVVLSALKETLERAGFPVVACNSPLKALAILAERDFAVIISDQRMPEMLGLDFLVESRRIRPFASAFYRSPLSSRSRPSSTRSTREKSSASWPSLGSAKNCSPPCATPCSATSLVTHNEALQIETQGLNAKLLTANAELEEKVRDLEQQRLRLDRLNHELAERASITRSSSAAVF